MPALRKSARDRDFRSQPHTSSTTPYASPTGISSESVAEKKQRSITEWTEPQPQQLVPSFEEHGFARHGVLENMAPLGVPPKTKDKQRARVLEEPLSRHVLLERSGISFGDGVSLTPEVTPAPELEPDESDQEEDLDYEIPDFWHDEDEEYEPMMKPKKKLKLSKTQGRGKTQTQSKTPNNDSKTPTKNGYSKSISTPTSSTAQTVQALQPADAAQQRMLIAVNDAISRANKNDRRPVGVALKEIFEESKVNIHLASALDSIIQRDSTEEQWELFRVRVKSIRKRIKRENKRKRMEEKRCSRPSSQDRVQDSPRASGETVAGDLSSVACDVNDSLTPVNLATDNIHQTLQSDVNKDSFASAIHPFSAAPALLATQGSIESAPRLPSKSPRKRVATNGSKLLDSEMNVNGAASAAARPSGGKTSESGGSDSELSEVNEDIVQKGPPEPVQAHGKSNTSIAATSLKKGKNLALARAAKKAKANAGRLFGKHAHKHRPPTAEQAAEEERIWEVRKTLVEQQLIRQFDQIPLMVSDVRFDDEMLETESLTESQIAIGPPVDGDQPHRVGRVPNQGTKREREDDCQFSSPHFNSATATRPSTPVLGPKRIKLTNGQTARTKRSPIKSREGGPVAGVAFNSGGGSRQLGPDDHNPNSPQSDSDDFCSACRGAGEFVCCEGCPRVFHLLCCDPPRIQVPDGAFYCYECHARLGTSDEAVAESYARLGSLFKSLERTNPRAFALPRDIQQHFEGVDARSDGSYFEEIKKVPLAKSSGYGYQRPDYTRVLDGESNSILCTQCGLSSGRKRQMLKCDFCHAHWHLDCVDPPLANPPPISIDASQRDAWRCPRHIEHDFHSGLLVQQDLNEPRLNVNTANASSVARITRKIRKPREPEVVEPTFSRGMRNNGLIEILNDPDDDTDGEGNYVFGPDDPKDLNAKIFRIPEKGIILDFVSKVKSSRITKARDGHRTSIDATRRKAYLQNFFAHPMHQQQAALNLTQFAKRQSDIGLNEGKVSALILGLTSEAPSEVIDAVENAAPPPLTLAEREQLLKLEQLIQRRLNT